MKLKYAIIQNFLSVGDEVTIPLDLSGLTLIAGDNQDAPKADSNGAGKSLILSSISWCWFGETVDGLKADEVVNNKVNRDCKVTVVAEEGEDTYSVTRTRLLQSAAKPNDLFFSKNGKDLSGSTNEITQAKINKFTGLDLELFKALMPGSDFSIAAMTDKEIKLLLEKILKTEEMSAAYQITMEKHKALDKELSINRTKLLDIDKSIAASKNRSSQYKTNSDNFENNRLTETASLQSSIDKITKEITHLKCSILIGAINIPKYEEELRTTGLSLKELSTKVSSAQEKLRKVDLQFTKLHSPLVSEKTSLEKKTKDVAGITTCSTCLSEVTEKHKEHVGTECAKKVKELSFKIEKLANKKDSMAADLKEELEKYLTEKGDLEKRQLDITKALNSQKEMARQNELIDLQVNSKKEALTDLQSRLELMLGKVNDFNDLIQQEDSNILTLEAEHEAESKRITTQEEELAYLKFWVDSFSPAGIRSYMIENVVPFLNEKAAYYSKILTDNEMSVSFSTKTTQKSGKSVEKFSIVVSHKHGSAIFKGSSKGEKRRANMVVSLVLGDLAALRSSKLLSFRMFDEIFEAVDKTGCKYVIELLQKFSSKYESIYVVTHMDDLKAYFSKCITIQKKNGFSSLKEIEA